MFTTSIIFAAILLLLAFFAGWFFILRGGFLPLLRSTFVSSPFSRLTTYKELKEIRDVLDEWAIVSFTDLDGVITYANKKLCEISKYLASELQGNKHSILNSGYHSPSYFQNLWTTIKSGKVWQGEFRNRAKDGSHFWVEALIKPFVGPGGRIVGYLSIGVDVTPLKKAGERQTHLLEKLSSANKELTDFSSIISHDLKGPLKGLSSLLEWLRGKYESRLDDEGIQALALIQARLSRMQGFVEGLLKVASVGMTEEMFEDVNLNSVVREAIDLLMPPPHIEIQYAPLPKIRGERLKFHQLFQYVIGNAIKFMDKPKGRIFIGATERDDHWMFFVKDNGPGIAREHHERIFHVFETLGRSADPRGFGVGLAVVKKIVERYGGRVWVESVLGEGTVLTWTIPKKTGIFSQVTSAYEHTIGMPTLKEEKEIVPQPRFPS